MPTVFVVMGPPGAGKTTIRNRYLFDYPTVDLWDFQKEDMTLEEIKNSYVLCEVALRELMHDNPGRNLVLEHTLMKDIRWPQYINAIKEEAEILKTHYNICFVPVKPKDVDEYRKRVREDGGFLSKTYGQQLLDMMDMPTTDFPGIDEVRVLGVDNVGGNYLSTS